MHKSYILSIITIILVLFLMGCKQDQSVGATPAVIIASSTKTPEALSMATQFIDLDEFSCESQPLYAWGYPGTETRVITYEDGRTIENTFTRQDKPPEPASSAMMLSKDGKECNVLGDWSVLPGILPEVGGSYDFNYSCPVNAGALTAIGTVTILGYESKETIFGTVDVLIVRSEIQSVWADGDIHENSIDTWYLCGPGRIYSDYYYRNVWYGYEQLTSFTPLSK